MIPAAHVKKERRKPTQDELEKCFYLMEKYIDSSHADKESLLEAMRIVDYRN